MADKREVVRLYRQILKLAKQYPSIKRDAIIQDIKLEFHDAKHLTDARAIQHKIGAARSGIMELSQYTSMTASSPTWKVDVGRDVSANANHAAASPNVKVVGDKQQ